MKPRRLESATILSMVTVSGTALTIVVWVVGRVVIWRADRGWWLGRGTCCVPLARECSRTPPRATGRPPNAAGLMTGATRGLSGSHAVPPGVGTPILGVPLNDE